MNEPWVIKMLSSIATGGGIPYDPESTDKDFALGVTPEGRLYVKLSQSSNANYRRIEFRRYQ